MITVMQFLEGLTDRQAAESVRSRIDWKYMLGLRLDDSGFDYSVLSEFRHRLLAGVAEMLLLDKLLEGCDGLGLLKGKKKQRTDSTNVIAAVRALSLLETVGEMMRRVLDEGAQIAPEWIKRYGRRFDGYRLPTDKVKREALAVEIGEDGYYLLQAIAETGPTELKESPKTELMRRIWIQQYYWREGKVHWRTTERNQGKGVR